MPEKQDSDLVCEAGEGRNGTDEEKTSQDTANHNGINVRSLHSSFRIVNMDSTWMCSLGNIGLYICEMPTTCGPSAVWLQE